MRMLISSLLALYPQKNLFMFVAFSFRSIFKWFSTKMNSAWWKIDRKSVITIYMFWINKIPKIITWVYDASKLHTEKSFLNLIKSNQKQIVFIIFRLIWHQTDSVRLVLNQSWNGKYNLISVWFNKISKKLYLFVVISGKEFIRTWLSWGAATYRKSIGKV